MIYIDHARRMRMAAKRKPLGTRVRDQLHVGMRFPEPLASVVLQLVARANSDRAARGQVPTVTVSSLVARWVAERAVIEEQNVLGTATIHERMGGTLPDPSKQKSYLDHINDARDEMRAEQEAKIKLRQIGREP
jgi:hypothetical protein